MFSRPVGFFFFVFFLKLLISCLIHFCLLLKGHGLFNLNCLEDNKLCTLVSKDSAASALPEVKAVASKCLNEACKDSIVLGENKELYLCSHLSKKLAECQYLNGKNAAKIARLNSLLDRKAFFFRISFSKFLNHYRLFKTK